VEQRTVLAALGALRGGVGIALAAAPQLAAVVWVGPSAGGSGTSVFARTLGGRDLALGLTTLALVRSGDLDAASRSVQLGIVCDVADALATVASVRDLSGPRRWVMPIATVAAALGEVAVLRRVADGRASA
jgi:hypothetical protein